mmetsp:Transcript_17498/g.61144  ORF Transcript_17498/g.61144 Transcript_17498/m.61144 type:complete len:367 (+) Transcript_17498:705-1805(+)
MQATTVEGGLLHVGHGAVAEARRPCAARRRRPRWPEAGGPESLPDAEGGGGRGGGEDGQRAPGPGGGSTGIEHLRRCPFRAIARLLATPCGEQVLALEGLLAGSELNIARHHDSGELAVLPTRDAPAAQPADQTKPQRNTQGEQRKPGIVLQPELHCRCRCCPRHSPDSGPLLGRRPVQREGRHELQIGDLAVVVDVDEPKGGLPSSIAVLRPDGRPLIPSNTAPTARSCSSTCARSTEQGPGVSGRGVAILQTLAPHSHNLPSSSLVVRGAAHWHLRAVLVSVVAVVQQNNRRLWAAAAKSQHDISAEGAQQVDVLPQGGRIDFPGVDHTHALERTRPVSIVHARIASPRDDVPAADGVVEPELD